MFQLAKKWLWFSDPLDDKTTTWIFQEVEEVRLRRRQIVKELETVGLTIEKALNHFMAQEECHQ
jgi:hypothetical protein